VTTGIRGSYDGGAVRERMADQWDAFGPIALVFWMCWIAFTVLTVSGLALFSGSLLVSGGIGLVVTTLLYEVADAIDGR